MTYHLHITGGLAQKDQKNRLYKTIALSIGLINTVCFLFIQNIQIFVVLNIGIAGLVLWMYTTNIKKKMPYISIQDSRLEYYCLKENQVISISADEITHISHRFCELRVHTPNKVHYLSLEPVLKEKKRWEIKEMIKQWAHSNEYINAARY